jgi:hypothetical protein
LIFCKRKRAKKMEKVQVIGHLEANLDKGYSDSKYADVWETFHHFLRGKGWRGSVDVRNPFQNEINIRQFWNQPNQGTHWHRDGGEGNEAPVILALWGWPVSTEVRDFETKEPILVWPGDVIVFDNLLVEHRYPHDYVGPRWFARGWDLHRT